MSIVLLVIGLGESGARAAAQVQARLPGSFGETVLAIGVGLTPYAQLKPDHALIPSLREQDYLALQVSTVVDGVPTHIARQWDDLPAFVRTWLAPEALRFDPPSRAVERLAWTMNLSGGVESGLYRLWSRQLSAARTALIDRRQGDRALNVCLIADLGEVGGGSLIADAVYLCRAVGAQMQMPLFLRGYTLFPYETSSAEGGTLPRSGVRGDAHMRAYATLREIEQFLLAPDQAIGYPFQYRQTSDDASVLGSGWLREALFDQWYAFDRQSGAIGGVEAVSAAIASLRSEAGQIEDAARIVNVMGDTAMRQRDNQAALSTQATATLVLPVDRLEQALAGRVVSELIARMIAVRPEDPARRTAWLAEVDGLVQGRMRSTYPLGDRLRWMFDPIRATDRERTLDLLESRLVTTPITIALQHGAAQSAGTLPAHLRTSPADDPYLSTSTLEEMQTLASRLGAWTDSYAAPSDAGGGSGIRSEQRGAAVKRYRALCERVIALHEQALYAHLRDMIGSICDQPLHDDGSDVQPLSTGGLAAAIALLDSVRQSIESAQVGLSEARRTMQPDIALLRQTYERAIADFQKEARTEPRGNVFQRHQRTTRLKDHLQTRAQAAHAVVTAACFVVLHDLMQGLLARTAQFVVGQIAHLRAWRAALEHADATGRAWTAFDLTRHPFPDERVPMRGVEQEAVWLEQMLERAYDRAGKRSTVRDRLKWQPSEGTPLRWQLVGQPHPLLGGEAQTTPYFSQQDDVEPFLDFCRALFSDLTTSVDILLYLQQMGTLTLWAQALRQAESIPLHIRARFGVDLRTTYRLYVPTLTQAAQQTALDQLRAYLLIHIGTGSAPSQLAAFAHPDRQRIIYTQTVDAIDLYQDSAAYTALNHAYYDNPTDWTIYHAFAFDRLTSQFEQRYGVSPEREAIKSFTQPEYALRFWMAFVIDLIQVREWETATMRGVSRRIVFAPPDSAIWSLTALSSDPDDLLLSALLAFCAGRAVASTAEGIASGQITYSERPRYPFDTNKRDTSSTARLKITTQTLISILSYIDERFAETALPIVDSSESRQAVLPTMTDQAQANAALWQARASTTTTPLPMQQMLSSGAHVVSMLAWAHDRLQTNGLASAERGHTLARDLYWGGALLMRNHMKHLERQIGQFLARLP